VSAQRLVEDVARGARALDELFAGYPSESWDCPIRSLDGRVGPARQVVATRWCEVEAHHVDLDVGYRIEDWPAAFAERLLPETLSELRDRADPSALLGWLIGRGPAPTLVSWG
jgi:maleylpyruvate isomerase